MDDSYPSAESVGPASGPSLQPAGIFPHLIKVRDSNPKHCFAPIQQTAPHGARAVGSDYVLKKQTNKNPE